MYIATSQSCNGISGEPSSSSPPVNLRSGALRGGRKVTKEPAYAFILPNLEQYPADFRHFLERDIIEISTLRSLEEREARTTYTYGAVTVRAFIVRNPRHRNFNFLVEDLVDPNLFLRSDQNNGRIGLVSIRVGNAAQRHELRQFFLDSSQNIMETFECSIMFFSLNEHAWDVVQVRFLADSLETWTEVMQCFDRAVTAIEDNRPPTPVLSPSPVEVSANNSGEKLPSLDGSNGEEEAN
ncbi:hypothetical protein niasHS_014307 [Heterodera schachtii]|uniref:Uncharacterized protein n=1 Tax=Heterodera schachtii TaxID=97005 RepID=A0ABD2I708_HETSC